MKRIIPITLMLLSSFGFMACQHEEEDIFPNTAAERLNSASDIYSQRLTDSKGGWVMEYYPYSDNENLVTGNGYVIVNRFHDNGAVYTAMKNDASYGVFVEDSTAWEVLTYMGPVLTYNSYNTCLGRFADPYDIDYTTGSGNDEEGKGFRGDYEFVVVDAPENGDHIMLKGVKRGMYVRLSRLPEGTQAEEYLDDIETFNKTHFIDNANWELLMTDNGQEYRMNYMDRRCGTVYPEGKDSTAYGWHEPFLITKYNDKYHLRFKDTLMVEGRQMEQEFVYNEDEEVFHGVVDPDNTIKGYPAGRFIGEKFGEHHRWQINVERSYSADFDAVLSAMVAEMASGTVKYEVDPDENGRKFIILSQEGDDIVMDIPLKFRRSNKDSKAHIYYKYKATHDEHGLTLSYSGVGSDASTTFYDTFASLKQFVEKIGASYTASGYNSSYDLSTIRLSNAGDASSWIVLQYAN